MRKIKLTKKEYAELTEQIMESLVGRSNTGALAGKRKKATINDEINFLCGAMAVMMCFNIQPPGAWIFAPLRGDSILNSYKAKLKEKCRQRAARTRGSRYAEEKV